MAGFQSASASADPRLRGGRSLNGAEGSLSFLGPANSNNSESIYDHLYRPTCGRVRMVRSKGPVRIMMGTNADRTPTPAGMVYTRKVLDLDTGEVKWLDLGLHLPITDAAKELKIGPRTFRDLLEQMGFL